MVGRRHSAETYHDQKYRILAAILWPGGAVIPQHDIMGYQRCQTQGDQEHVKGITGSPVNTDDIYMKGILFFAIKNNLLFWWNLCVQSMSCRQLKVRRKELQCLRHWGSTVAPIHGTIGEEQESTQTPMGRALASPWRDTSMSQRPSGKLGIKSVHLRKPPPKEISIHVGNPSFINAAPWDKSVQSL